MNSDGKKLIALGLSPFLVGPICTGLGAAVQESTCHDNAEEVASEATRSAVLGSVFILGGGFIVSYAVVLGMIRWMNANRRFCQSVSDALEPAVIVTCILSTLGMLTPNVALGCYLMCRWGAAHHLNPKTATGLYATGLGVLVACLVGAIVSVVGLGFGCSEWAKSRKAQRDLLQAQTEAARSGTGAQPLLQNQAEEGMAVPPPPQPRQTLVQQEINWRLIFTIANEGGLLSDPAAPSIRVQRTSEESGQEQVDILVTAEEPGTYRFQLFQRAREQLQARMLPRGQANV